MTDLPVQIYCSRCGALHDNEPDELQPGGPNPCRMEVKLRPVDWDDDDGEPYEYAPPVLIICRDCAAEAMVMLAELQQRVIDWVLCPVGFRGLHPGGGDND